jgi:NADPH2:quinone reductase
VRRVLCSSFGPLDQLAIVEESDPDPTEGSVVIKVGAAGANYVDALIVQGRYQIKPPLPFTPGMEIAGSDVDTGERVLAVCWFGGYASHVTVPRAGAFPIPDGVTIGQAATLVQSYATARFALTRRMRLEPAEWVAVLGAGGGVGLATIDVAKALGAQVVACASSRDKLEAARSAGADAFVAYEDEGVDLKTAIREATGGGADVVVDPVGGDKADAALRSLRWGGRYVVIGFAGGGIPSLRANQVLLNNRTIVGVDWGAWTVRDPAGNAELIAGVLADVAAGQLHPVEPVPYALDDVVRCLSDLESRRVVGKAALVP